MNKRIIKIIFFISICFSACKANAQTALEYYVLPMNTMVSIGEKMTLRLQYHDQNFHARNGTAAFVTGVFPQWTIISASNSDVGSIHPDLPGFSAVYTAPASVPKTNPVIVAVKFKANDTSKQVVTVLCRLQIIDPGENWFFVFSGTKSSEETIKSNSREFVKRENASGNTSMLIDAAPPQSGYTIINTEQGDKVLNAAVGGSYSYYQSDIEKAIDGSTDEKTLRNYSGTPDKNSQGLLFEYNAADKTDQQGIQGAGVSFNVTGTDEFWKPDVNTGKLKKQSSPFSQKNFSGISAGNKEDKVSKIKNGFAIDFSQSKDTTYNDYQGSHTIKSSIQYHAELTRVNKK